MPCDNPNCKDTDGFCPSCYCTTCGGAGKKEDTCCVDCNCTGNLNDN